MALDKGYNIFIPQRLLQCRGLIKNVPETITEQNLVINGEAIQGIEKIKVLSARRLNRNVRDETGTLTKVPTSSYLLTFEGRNIPSQFILYKTITEVETFINPVIQCQKCLRFGHSKELCRGKTRCAGCSEEHNISECRANKLICLYCSKNHLSTDRSCEEFSRQIKINQAMAERNLSFVEAAQLNPSSQDNGMSNHFPIICELEDGQANFIENSPHFIYNTKKANWDQFEASVTRSFDTTPPQNYSDFHSILIRTADQAIPKIKHSKGNFKGHIWWDSECSAQIKRKRDAFRSYKSQSTQENFIEWKKLRAQTRRLLRQKRRASFKEFCSSLSPSSNLSSLWGKVKRFSGAFSTSPRPWPSNVPIAKTMLTNLASPYIPNEESNSHSHNLEPSLAITKNEIISTIRLKKHTTPGLDKISYPMLQHLPDVAINYLEKYFNSLLMGQNNIPLDWKTHLVYPILKPQKDPNLVSSYRPISLSSCIGKILDFIIKNRLEFHLESKNIFYPLQSGFRRGKSVMDNLSVISMDVSLSLFRGESAIMVLLDVSAA